MMTSPSKACRIILLFLVLGMPLACGGTGTVTPPPPNNNTPQNPPAAPTGVTATAGDGQVTVSWNAAAGATYYNIYWSTSSGVTTATGTRIGNVTNTSLIHTGLTNGVTYYYVVTAVNANGESTASTQTSATPSSNIPPPPPA